jgi:hypothetical protein
VRRIEVSYTQFIYMKTAIWKNSSPPIYLKSGEETEGEWEYNGEGAFVQSTQHNETPSKVKNNSDAGCGCAYL